MSDEYSVIKNRYTTKNKKITYIHTTAIRKTGIKSISFTFGFSHINNNRTYVKLKVYEI